MIAGKKCFLAHGHTYGVGLDTRMIAEEAEIRGCEVAMFGHTHKPYDRVVDGILCLNPGSVSYPRQADRRPSFLVIESDEKGQWLLNENYVVIKNGEMHFQSGEQTGF